MVIILGLGFTGQRVARRLLRQGGHVFAAVRGVDRFRGLAEAGLNLTELASIPSSLPRRATLVDLIPPLPEEENAALRATIDELEPRRVIYISSTGVYGEQAEVDAETPACPNDERGRKRLEEELWIASHPWSTLILRSAAIYGPGRGVHAAIREGKVPRGAGSGIVSRIHVDDLAALIQAAIGSNLEGAWPVADDEPCSTAEIAAWCADRFEIKDFHLANDGPQITGRRVYGTRIREELRIELRYPSWKTGVPASLREEEKLNQAAEGAADIKLT